MLAVCALSHAGYAYNQYRVCLLSGWSRVTHMHAPDAFSTVFKASCAVFQLMHQIWGSLVRKHHYPATAVTLALHK